MQQTVNRLKQDSDKLFWYGEDVHTIVNIPSSVLLQEVDKLYKYSYDRGAVTHDTYPRIVEKVQQYSYWIDTVYCVPKYVQETMKEVRIDSLTHNLIDYVVVGEKGVYFQVLLIDQDYVIVRRIGSSTQEIIFNDRLHPREVEAVRRFVFNAQFTLNTPVNLMVNFRFNFDTIVNWINERYIVIEC